MLVDSSVWIPYLNGTPQPVVDRLVHMLQAGEAVWLAPPILQEVLQGADRPERFARWDRVLGALPMFEGSSPKQAARDAAQLYARCRWAGITPRSANDCLIAVLAMEAGMPLLHDDVDFERIERMAPRLLLVPRDQ